MSGSQERSLRDQITEIRKRTVRIELPRSRSYTRVDVISALAVKVKIEHLEALGTAKFNNVWEATLVSKAAADHLLTHGNIIVGEVSGRLSSMDSSKIKVRIHWTPYWVPNRLLDAAIRKELPPGAVLEGIGSEKSSIPGAQHVATLVRFALVKYSGDPADLPHLVKVVAENQELEVLLTVQGRRPVCLRCRRVGHIRQTCAAPYCVGCRGYGHTKEECRNHFAAAVAGPSAPQEEGPVPDETMEEERVEVPPPLEGAAAMAAGPPHGEDSGAGEEERGTDVAVVEPPEDHGKRSEVPPDDDRAVEAESGELPMAVGELFALSGDSLGLSSQGSWTVVESPKKKRLKSQENGKP